MSTVLLKGITIGYDDIGIGEPLVLVHGHPFNRSMWRPQIKRFSDSRRVIAPDLRGYGESTPVPGKTGLATFAHDIAALLDHLGLEHSVLAGLSMGGQIVLEFHRLFPERVRGLVLADTFADAETDAGKKQRNDLADRLLREGMEAHALELLPKMVTPHNLKTLPMVAEHVLEMMRSTPPEGAAAALRGRAERPDYVSMLPEIAVPTLIVVGSNDEFTPVADGEFMHQRIPGSALVVIDEAGHMPNLEREAEFDTALGRFLESVTATTHRER